MIVGDVAGTGNVAGECRNLPARLSGNLRSSFLERPGAAGKNGDIGESIEFLSAAIESHPEMAEAEPEAQSLARLGIKLTIETTDTAQYLAREAEFDFELTLHTAPWCSPYCT